MLLASIIATIYYDDWSLDTMSGSTLFFIGGGTLWFTFVCIFWGKTYNVYLRNIKNDIGFRETNIKRVVFFLYFLILLGIITILIRLKVYASYFGSTLDVSSLIWAAREDATEGSQKFVLPLYIKLLSIVNSLCSYFTVWLLALQFHCHKRHKRLVILLLIQIAIVCIDGLIGGTKGGLIDPFIRYFSIYILLLYYKKRTTKLPKPFLLKLLILILITILSFQMINMAMGRKVESTTAEELFAVYCGAEIKNFDTYIQNPSKFGKSKYWGGTTLNTFYSSLGKTDNSYGVSWEFVNGKFLGNVFTQYYPYHRDWGGAGVFIVLLVIAYFSMFFYKKALVSIRANVMRPNIFVLLYSVMASNLFMSFFSGRFAEVVFQIGFIKIIIYVLIMKTLYINYFIKKSI